MNKVFAFSVLIFVCCIGYSQNITVKGFVSTNDAKDFSGYTVAFLNKNDSTFYKGDFFLDKSFEIYVEKQKLPLIMKISSLGYKSIYIYVDKNKLLFPNILLETDPTTLLPGVTVKGNIPIYSIKGDRLTMNVSNTVLSQAGTAIDVLQKAARVKIDNSGISVIGVGNAIVIVDGRLLPSTEALESISSSDIEKVDILTNPSAKYDASGKAVIEITTKKAKEEGFGAEVNARLGKGKKWRNYLGTEFSAKTKNISCFASYSYAPMKYKNNENYDYDYPDASEEYTIDRKTKLNYKNNHNFKLSMDYNISPEHLLGIQLSGQLRDIHSDIYNTNKILNDQNSTTFISDQDRNTNRKYYSSTIYYSFIPKSKKSSFNILYDKSDFNNRNITDINENQVLKINYDKADINMNAVKADWQTKLSGSWIFNAGGKYSYVTNSSTIRFTNNGTETSAINYKYKENIGALYVLLSKQLNKISYEGGIRMETTGNKAWDNGTIIHKKNSNVDLFPSLSIAYRLYKDWSLSASYATKINRPTFQDMNPAINYIDSLSYFQGNPNLVPEKQYAGNFKVSYKSYASIGFSYIHRNNMLAWYVEQDKTYPAITKATEKNIDKSDTYSIDLVLPYQNKWLTCYVATGVILTNSNDKEAEIIDLNKPMWYAYSEFDMNLPHDMKLGTNIRYYTKGVENVYYFDPVFRMDLSLQKNFLKNKLTATLLWNDIFSSDKMNTYTTFGTRHVRYNYYFDQSVVQLSLTYRFKTAKAKYKSKSSLNEENNRIKGF